jgi:hypothetical protein
LKSPSENITLLSTARGAWVSIPKNHLSSECIVYDGCTMHVSVGFPTLYWKTMFYQRSITHSFDKTMFYQRSITHSLVITHKVLCKKKFRKQIGHLYCLENIHCFRGWHWGYLYSYPNIQFTILGKTLYLWTAVRNVEAQLSSLVLWKWTRKKGRW